MRENKEAVRTWSRQARADGCEHCDALTSEEREELKRLRKEVVELQRANPILKDVGSTGNASGRLSAPARRPAGFPGPMVEPPAPETDRPWKFVP